MKKINYVINIFKWLWKFSPLMWLIIFSFTVFILCLIINAKIFGLPCFAILLTVWLFGVISHTILKENGSDIKEYFRKWWEDRPR